jgi:Icc protein
MSRETNSLPNATPSDDASTPDRTLDRRNVLKCMAWCGGGLLWSFAGGIPTSRLLADTVKPHSRAADFTFAQISDSHIGFNKAANPDVTGTLREAVAKIRAQSAAPDFVLHTGDLSHNGKAAEYDAMEQVLTDLKSPVFYVPGEHDTAGDDGKLYRERFAKGHANGWHSFQHKGSQFFGLSNVEQIEGMGRLGPDQVKWMKDQLAGLSSSTPIVVFAHIPLWAVYPEWGWNTPDSVEVFSSLKRFGSVTVLNGHIHQVVQKKEGNVTFHTAMSTAFPQPAPGTAPAPGPMKVPAEKLKSVLGLTEVHFQPQKHAIAVIDDPLAS